MRVFWATLLSLFVFATPALADNPLLSGYSGPGGLDQSLLGGGLVGGGGGSSKGGGGSGGSLRAPARAVATAAPGAAGTLADVSRVPPLTPKPSRTVATPAAKRESPAVAPAAKTPASASGTASAGAPAATATRTATQGSGGGSSFPISAADLLVLLLGAAALLGLARVTARLGAPPAPSI